MKRSIYKKFLRAYLLFGLLSFFLVTVLADQMIFRYLVRSNADRLYNEACHLAAVYENEGSYRMDASELIPEIRHIGAFSDSRIWVLSPDGYIVMDSENTLTGKVIPGFRLPENGSYAITSYSGTFSENILSVCAPIFYNNSTTGYIAISCPMSSVTAGSDDLMYIVYMMSLLVFLLSGIILIVVNSFIFRPLEEISRGAENYAQGNLSYRIRINSNDEIGYLSDTLNYMSERLADSEQAQKDFVANVSHDFRSPLTSVKGYIQAILDGVIPPEMHEKYLNRILSETDRLNKLTEELMSLNQAGGRKLRKSSFDINRTIRDVCAMNERQCSEKGLSFELIFENETEMVYADYSCIQQVLYNLIDNAIKFSYPDSVICISTSLKAKKVYTSVKDNGIGIPRASIKKIWNRFYKTDISRGKDKKGSGLGLAIVKEIILAHDENIDVVSTEKIGTEFVFSLPVSEDPGILPQTDPGVTV